MACLATVLLALAWWPLSFHVRIWQARRLLHAGDVSAAEAVLKAIEPAGAGHAETQFLLGRVRRRMGAIVEATGHLETAQGLGWNAVEVHEQQVLLFVQIGRSKDVEAKLHQMLRRDNPELLAEEIYEAQAKGFLATYRLDDALLCLNYWLQWRPDNRLARLWRAEIYEHLDDWQSAAGDYDMLASRFPGDAEIRIKHGNALLERNQVQEAEREFRAGLALRPGDASARIGVAKCLRRQGASADAEREFQSLLQASLTKPERAEILTQLGEQALFRNEPERAIEWLTQAAELNPLDRGVFHSLALATSRLNDRERALAFASRSEALLKKAYKLQELTEAVTDRPDHAPLRHEIGTILMDVGMGEAGAAWMHTALLCDPAHQPSHRSLAEYYAKVKDRAREEFHRRRLVGPASPALQESASPNSGTLGPTDKRTSSDELRPSSDHRSCGDGPCPAGDCRLVQLRSATSTSQSSSGQVLGGARDGGHTLHGSRAATPQADARQRSQPV